MTDIVLQARSLTRNYDEGERRVNVLCGADLVVRAGEMIAIIGASGSGKSTLLHCLGLLDRPNSGEIVIGGQSTASLTEQGRSQLRNQRLGFVYQFHHLLSEFSAIENVAMPLVIRGEPLAIAREKAAKLLTRLGLQGRAEHFPGQLSGGERQRVALARALVTNPVCVLADEPTGNLDRETAHQMFALLVDVRQQFGTALVLVTHDLALAARADRQLRLIDGQLRDVEPGAD